MLARIKRFLGLEDKPKEQAKPIKPKEEESSQQEVEKVADKPKIGYFHLSGCTGDGIALTENYDILAELLTDMVDIVYGQTLVDVWYDDENNPYAIDDMPEMDLALVEGSVCLQDEHSIHELKKLREKAKLVCAFGSCAMNGCFTRYCRGGQQAQPKHEAFLPIGDIVQVDCTIPGCPVSPEIVAKVVVALINGDMDYLQPMLDMAGCTANCGCDLQKNIVNKSLCTGCGTCAMACQTRAIEMREGRPEVNIDRCIKCGICYTHCPRSWFPTEQINKDLGL
ncbi:Coenzyme F420 hydrogenase subunit gamma [Candidatus Methanobinarius endosymbioticus]|uniref:Coenzyme F420 hydrogenase subunit gamma n=1 Tax=Candidatus Methanobinarius endosymbioticus TaxID=2006182 RepID=A0A366MAZ3_9EURY|nr:Coenzyme F420 hydrogenase subunit gamma [Candidatus Methanobinarius endosymbioticus]